MVLALAEAGYAVAIQYGASGAAARALAADIQSRGGVASCWRASLLAEAPLRGLVRRVVKAHGRLDVLVNNAASFPKGPLRKVAARDLDEVFRLNLFAPILLTKFFAEVTASGCVINLLDRRITSHDPTCVPYLLTKKALAAFTESAALALAPGIRVNGVAPGPVLPPPGRDARYLRARGGRVPLARRLVPEDIAAAVLSLLAQPAVTGQILYVDGGQHLLGEP